MRTNVKLSQYDDTVKKLIRYVRNKETEQLLTEEWKEFKRTYLDYIAGSNPYFMIGAFTGFMTGYTLILEAKRKYFMTGKLLDPMTEKLVDSYLVYFTRIFVEQTNRAYAYEKAEPDIVYHITASYAELATKKLKEKEEEIGLAVTQPDNYFNVIKATFNEWFITYQGNPRDCIDKYLPKQQEEPKLDDPDNTASLTTMAENLTDKNIDEINEIIQEKKQVTAKENVTVKDSLEIQQNEQVSGV